MNISEFYDFGSKYVSSTIQVEIISFGDLTPIEIGVTPFDEVKLIKGEYSNFIFPLVFKQGYGKKYQDILDTGFVSLNIISDRLKILLEENKLTGWKTYNVKILNKKEEEINGYHGFSVTGKCGPIDYNKSEIIEKRRVPTGPLCRFYKGTYIGLDKWDGSDFFIPENTIEIVVTKKAAEILKKNKLTNIQLKNLADSETSLSIIDNITKTQITYNDK